MCIYIYIYTCVYRGPFTGQQKVGFGICLGEATILEATESGGNARRDVIVYGVCLGLLGANR